MRLGAISSKEKELLQDIVAYVMDKGDGSEPLPYAGRLAQILDLPDPAPTKTIDRVPKWSTEGDDEEQVTDNWYHSCSVLMERLPDGSLLPKKIIFQARLESGRDSETYNFKTSLDGTIEKVDVGHGKVDEKGNSIRGSAATSSTLLDENSPDVKSKFQHELDLWLHGKYLKPKVRKNLRDALDYYRKKRQPASAKKPAAKSKP